MKDQFKQWAESISRLHDAYNHTDKHSDNALAVCELLQSLADMSEQEPDEMLRTKYVLDENYNSVKEKVAFVTKANRDWWRSKAIIAEQMRDQQNERVLGYQIQLRQKAEELAAANARIAELEKSNMLLIAEKAGWIDQPKRPILEPEVFDALINYIEAVAYGQGLRSNASREYNNLRKLWVGE